MGGDNGVMPTPIQEPEAAASIPASMPRGSPWLNPTPGGVVSPTQAPTQSENPFLQQYGQDVSSLYPAAMASASRQNSLNGQMAQFGGGSGGGQQQSGYPAYPNAFGLGDTSSFSSQEQAFNPQPAAVGAPSFQAQPLNQPASDSSSRGFNPWSLSGEANSRGQ